jgi:hypothetical protein
MILPIVVWTLLLGAAIPILMAWTRLSWGARRVFFVLLGLLTVSYVWLLLASVLPVVAGPHYSDMRVYLCDANIGVSVVTGLALCAFQKPRLLFALAAGWVAFGWAFFRSISFTL